MTRGKLILFFTLSALALAAGLGLGKLLLDEPRPPVELSSGFVLPDPRPLQPFTLTGQDGQPLHPDDLRGRWTFVYFGYTYCPDVCPTSLADLAAMERQLEERDLNGDTAYLLVSVDPRRDTPERLGEYTAYFHPKFRGATAAHEELEKLTSQVGVVYFVPKEPQDEDYTVDHSSTVILIDPQARLHAVFTSHEPAQLAADFGHILADWQDRS